MRKIEGIDPAVHRENNRQADALHSRGFTFDAQRHISDNIVARSGRGSLLTSLGLVEGQPLLSNLPDVLREHIEGYIMSDDKREAERATGMQNLAHAILDKRWQSYLVENWYKGEKRNKFHDDEVEDYVEDKIYIFTNPGTYPHWQTTKKEKKRLLREATKAVRQSTTDSDYQIIKRDGKYFKRRKGG